MLIQSSLFGEASGTFLKEEGMATAAINADMHEKNWCDKAYQFLTSWLYTKPVGFQFMTETVRVLAERSQIVPIPPSKRAWGGIITKARNAGLIKSIGLQQVSNPQAHCANATVWVKV